MNLDVVLTLSGLVLTLSTAMRITFFRFSGSFLEFSAPTECHVTLLHQAPVARHALGQQCRCDLPSRIVVPLDFTATVFHTCILGESSTNEHITTRAAIPLILLDRSSESDSPVSLWHRDGVPCCHLGRIDIAVLLRLSCHGDDQLHTARSIRRRIGLTKSRDRTFRT